MINLDNIDEIKKLDASNMAGSIEQLHLQVQQTFDEINKINIPESYKDFKNIVFSGMGGSALGAHVVEYLYGLELPCSFEIKEDYHLPKYVNENTLVVVGSYSGTTEETVSGLKEALDKKAKIIVIASGGTLEEIAVENKLPFYKIIPTYNPSNQPRMGIGYSVLALIALLARLSFVSLTPDDITSIKLLLEDNTKQNGIHVPTLQNQAKQLASSLLGKVPIFIAGEHVLGAIHAVRNQMNENAKSLAIYFPLPGLDHHLLEALRFPITIHNMDYYVLFNSLNYSDKIKKRLLVTKEMIDKNGHSTCIIETKGKTKLEEVINTINFGSYVGYYLALLNGIDPSPIIWVEQFKKLLS